MKTKTHRLLSVFLSLLVTFMCMTSATVQAVGSKMIFYFPSTVTASAGQDLQLDILVDNKISIKEMTNLILTIPDGFEVTGMSETSPAFNGSVTYTTSGNVLNFSVKSDGTVNSENVAVSIYLHVSENCQKKAYPFMWNSNAMSCITSDGYNYSPTMSYGVVKVEDSGGTTTNTTTTTTETTTTTTTSETTTTTTTTTETTTETTTTKKYTYSVYFVDEETNQAVSGVKYNIVSYDYARDPAQVVQTSGENPKSFEFISDTAYVEIVKTSKLETAIPDGYYIPDGATRWELSAENPDLTVYLRKAETTTTTTTETTTSATTTVSAYMEITINSLPTKTVYTIGEELNLDGGKWYLSGVKANGKKFVTTSYDMVFNSDFIDTSEFDNTKAGTYKIYIKMNHEDMYAENYFEVTVNEPETTTTTTTTTTTETTTTTATTQKHKYSVKFVDEETNELVSGVKYNIRSYYVLDPVQVVQTSGENPKSIEFISDTAYVSLTTVEKAIPDGYYIPDGATRWELSAGNPDLTVYLRKSATTATTETTTTTATTETTTTTASTYFNIIIDSYPKKTSYTIGEELDLSKGTFHAEGMDQYGRKFLCQKYQMTNTNVDISEFDNTKAGTYRIYIKWQIDTPIEAYSETFFEVTVTDGTETFNLGDINNDSLVDAVDASMVLTEYALISTSGIGEFTDNQKKSADLNNDGIMDSVDASLILAYYAYISTDGSDAIEKWLASQSL